MFLGIVGLAGFIVFGIMWIVSLITKNGKAKRNILTSLVCFAAFFATVFLLSDSEKEDTEADSNNDEYYYDYEEENNDDNDQNNEELFYVGDTAKLNDSLITIKKAEFVDPTEHTEPEEDKVLYIKFEIKNHSDDKLYAGSEEISVSNSANTQYKKYYAFGDGFTSDGIFPDKNIEGKLYYDVEDEEEYELNYVPEFGDDGEKAVFSINP